MPLQNIQNDTGKLATSVAREREFSSKLISDLARDIAIFKNSPMQVSTKSDPYIVNMNVIRQLHKQVQEERLSEVYHQNSSHFEPGIVRSIQSAWATFNEWQSRMSTSEWVSSAGRSDDGAPDSGPRPMSPAQGTSRFVENV
ncbi:hypothetical protein BKA62DRAFT_765940 [Auriculariales sp. MPI-PUGE-AT-0066]|nr:hypothetical protein BKA62DRAFT_765940 [Auriculariales sp. MPI-PUGE-AT-0066]